MLKKKSGEEVQGSSSKAAFRMTKGLKTPPQASVLCTNLHQPRFQPDFFFAINSKIVVVAVVGLGDIIVVIIQQTDDRQ